MNPADNLKLTKRNAVAIAQYATGEFWNGVPETVSYRRLRNDDNDMGTPKRI